MKWSRTRSIEVEVRYSRFVYLGLPQRLMAGSSDSFAGSQLDMFNNPSRNEAVPYERSYIQTAHSLTLTAAVLQYILYTKCLEKMLSQHILREILHFIMQGAI